MTPYWLALIRHAMTIAAGYFVASGKLDLQSSETLIGGAVGIAGVVWSLVAKKKPVEPAK